MFNKLPKIELHCHLDGSVRAETIIDIAKKENVNLPIYDKEELRKHISIIENCECLDEYIEKFDLTNLVMQNKYGLERIAYEVLEDASLENVKYIEIRFAPQLHRLNGLNYDEIIQSVINGVKKAEKDFDIKGNVIISTMRHMSEESGMEVIEVAKKYLGKGVVAFDMAGKEDEGFCITYNNLIKKAKEENFNITLHAGEQASYKNVIDAINLGATRIGHGIKIINSKETMDLVKEKNILLEMCPTSNIQTSNASDYVTYPFKKFLDYGIVASLNTDNRTVSNITLTKEYENIFNTLDFDLYKRNYLETVNASFSNEETKDWLRKFI
ncbi:MAG: adenosine deaminase [Peptostreptococcaceae bacterium]